MSSNIPHARALLRTATLQIAEAQRIIDEALALMDRRKPDFRAKRQQPSLTEAQKARARRLRKQGMSILDIAHKLNANHGRVSEACAEQGSLKLVVPT